MAFLGHHGKTEALLARRVEKSCRWMPVMLKISRYFVGVVRQRWRSVSAESARPHFDGFYCASFLIAAHGMPTSGRKALSPREKLCIPRVRGCTLPANGIRNFTRLVPFLHTFAANIREYLHAARLRSCWAKRNSVLLSAYKKKTLHKYIIIYMLHARVDKLKWIN